MDKLDKIADRISQDQRVRQAIKILTKKYDQGTRNYILNIYQDNGLHNIYNSMRAAAKIMNRPSDNQRLVVKYPNGIIYRFLNDVFSKKYGPDWHSEEQTLKKVMRNEELIKPWIIAEL